MQTATIREVQHHLASVLKQVEKGEEVEILRRRKAVARIIPLESDSLNIEADWSDHKGEVARIFSGKRVKGTPAELLVAEGRGDR